MFIGHYGVALAAKKLAPRVSLGTLFLAAQLLDLIWPTLVLLGIERVRIAPGITRVTPLDFEHYPYSHSLLAVLAWSILAGGGHYLKRGSRTAALVIGLLVTSHWLLDFLVHRPDLPILPWADTKTGLDGWSSYPLTLALELGFFGAGLWLYSDTTRPSDRSGKWGYAALSVLMVAIFFANTFGPPPPGQEISAAK